MDDPFSKTSRARVNSLMPPPLLPLPSFRRLSSTSRVSSAKVQKTHVRWLQFTSITRSNLHTLVPGLAPWESKGNNT